MIDISTFISPKSHLLHSVFFFIHWQGHFIRRWVEAFSDPRITFEIRNTWISFWSQVSIPSAKQALKMSLSRDHDGDNIN